MFRLRICEQGRMFVFGYNLGQRITIHTYVHFSLCQTKAKDKSARTILELIWYLLVLYQDSLSSPSEILKGLYFFCYYGFRFPYKSTQNARLKSTIFLPLLKVIAFQKGLKATISSGRFKIGIQGPAIQSLISAKPWVNF